MIEDILSGLVRANLAASAAVLLVLALRKPVRAAFGAQIAYALWAVAPMAAAAALLPQPKTATMLSAVVLTVMGGGEPVALASPTAATGPLLLFAAWLAGAAAAVLLVLGRQARFMASLGRLRQSPGAGARTFRAERAGVGPAVIGVLRPRIVTPADFEDRFAAEERGLMLAHERVHLARGDARINALAATIQCLSWFNPLAHLATRLMRIDQELACDAAVLTRRPALRRLYGEVLLKTQLVNQSLPLGCFWPPAGEHPLKERIVMLKSPLPAPGRRALGLAVVAALSLTGAVAAWAAQPAAQAPSLIIAPNWLQRPDGDDADRVYPATARQRGLARGGATLRCGIDAQGLLRGCTVVEEAPAQAGFGQAALALSGRFQMTATDKAGMATNGGEVRIPIRFVAPAQP